MLKSQTENLKRNIQNLQQSIDQKFQSILKLYMLIFVKSGILKFQKTSFLNIKISNINSVRNYKIFS